MIIKKKMSKMLPLNVYLWSIRQGMAGDFLLFSLAG